MANQKNIDAHKFKPGHSGNVAGRPKGTSRKGITDLLNQILDEKHSVTIDGKTKTGKPKRKMMTNREIIARELFAKAKAGNTWEINFVIERAEGRTPTTIHISDPDEVRVIG